MDSTLFRSGLPDHMIDELTEKCGGLRIRIPRKDSKHHALNRKRRNVLICQEWNNGETLDNIAQQFKLTPRSIWQILKNNGVQIRSEKKTDRRSQLEELLAGGYTKKRIAEMLGISRQRLYQILNEEGFKS